MIICPIYGLIPKKPNSLFNLNYYRNANPFVLNKIKIYYDDLVQLQLTNMDPINNYVIIHYTYFAKRKGTDLDNVMATCQKCFQDSLTKRLIKADDVSYVIANTQRFGGYDKLNPRIEAVLQEVDYSIAQPFYTPSGSSLI